MQLTPVFFVENGVGNLNFFQKFPHTNLPTQNQTILKTLKRKRILKTQFIKDSLLSDKKCCFLLDDDNLKVREHHFDWPQWVIFLSEGSSYFPTFTSIHLCSTRENKG